MHSVGYEKDESCVVARLEITRENYVNCIDQRKCKICGYINSIKEINDHINAAHENLFEDRIFYWTNPVKIVFDNSVVNV